MKKSAIHRLWLTTVVAIAMVPWSSCDDDDDVRPDGAIMPDAITDGPTTDQIVIDAAADLTDGEAAAILATINSAKIQQGAIGLTRGQDEDVRDLSVVLVNNHASSQQRLTTILTNNQITPQNTSINQLLQDDVSTINQQLQEAQLNQFDSIFLQNQVLSDQRALNLLNTTLIPTVQNTSLRNEMQRVRDDISDQLGAAQAIWNRINGIDAGIPDAPVIGDAANGDANNNNL